MKVIMYPAISLDGYIALPDGDSYSWVNQEDEARYQDAVLKAGCLLVGNATYQQYKEDFESYKNIQVFVCTHDESLEDDNHIKYVRGTAEEIISGISSQYTFEEMIVCGGGEINGMLAAVGLVDEAYISIQPVVLGEGIPLFGSFKPRFGLNLLSTNQDVPGVIQNHYEVIK